MVYYAGQQVHEIYMDLGKVEFIIGQYYWKLEYVAIFS
jgi:hypothetical protein